MISNNLMWSTLFLVMILMGTSQRHQALARSTEGLGRIEKLFSSSSSSGGSLNVQGASPLAALGSHSLPKRAVMDQSCKGIYDRELFKKLDRVCEDCYNLYRKPYVGIDCRANCYSNLVFLQCLDDLLLVDSLNDYVKVVQTVGK